MLTFVVCLLSTHPHVLVRLREEITSKRGPRNRPTYEAIREMKHLHAVINDEFLVMGQWGNLTGFVPDTLRLFPAV